MPRTLISLMSMFLAGLSMTTATASGADPTDDYIKAYLATFPSRATAAGLYSTDSRLEQLDQDHREHWIAFNETTRIALQEALAEEPDAALRLDRELLLRQVQQELLEWRDQDRPRTDPLFWAEILGQSTVYLALRRDRPAVTRLSFAADRTDQIPRLVAEALQAMAGTADDQVIPERAQAATERLRALAEFYRSGLPAAEGATRALARRLQRSGAKAADAIARLAARTEQMAATAHADFRLGTDYDERFRIVTGIDRPVSQILVEAHRELGEKRQEAAAYGRGVWRQFYPEQKMPLDDSAVLRQLFAAIEAARPNSTAKLVAQFSTDTDAAFAFAQSHELMSVPEPRTLVIDTAPAWLGGQSVGGVYPAGPFQPDAETLFLLPNIPDSAPDDAKARFFSAFNTAFNRMILTHELVPGHYVQLKVAARLPHPVRSLFGDGVYTEGWGSFSERLMLDLGWGGPPERLAHYKKQLENLARLIADISVHTRHWDQARLQRFLTEDALLDAQFASNLWQRAVLSSPQLTTYHLGYRDIHSIWLDWRREYPERPLREFVDGMLALGAVPVREYRASLLKPADPHAAH
ncbi:MAG: DUF885 family protein [Rhodanobacteraceae bacterium]|nr:DUF885 family protein [Rhodanobacteraceae bacterium]